jgi:hypothetical protein
MADTVVSIDTAPIAPPVSPAPPTAAAPAAPGEAADDASEPTDTCEVADEGAPRINFPPKDNSVIKVINRCLRAWEYAYDKETADLDEDDPDDDAWKAASGAYLRATPPLCGYENICHFIACINYASMREIVTHTEAEHYLANAKVAISAICHQQKPFTGERRPVGRPPKSHAAEEIK